MNHTTLRRLLLLTAPALLVAMAGPPAWAQADDPPASIEASQPEAPPPPSEPQPADDAAAPAETPASDDPTEVQTPPPEKPENDAGLGDDDVEFEGDKLRLMKDGATIAEGGVHVRTKDVDITADSAVMDEDQVWVRLVGNVVIRGDDMTTTASTLVVNLETSKWRVTKGRTVVQPGFFEEGVAEPVYLRGEKIEAPPDKDFIQALAATGTTCRKPHPHYHLRSNRIRVIPDKKVIFHRPSLYFFGNRIFRYPFDVTLSMRRKDNKFFPEFGQNEVEGYYAKLAYLYHMGAENGGLLRLHVTEKRGTGFGFDHDLETNRQSGHLSLFFEPAESALATRLSHRYRLSQAVSSNLTSSFQRNSGYYGNTQTLSSNLTFRRTVKDANSQLGFQHSLSDSSYSSSRRFSTNFTHRQRNGVNTNWDVRTTMRDSTFRAGQPSDKELEAAFEFRNQQARYDWQFLADNRFDLDGGDYTGDDTYRSLNRLPEVIFNTDTDRLKGWRPLGRISTKASLALGRFEQDPEDLEVGRAHLKLDFGGNERRITGNSRARTSARYYQSFYDDGSARYVLGLNSELRTRWDGQWTTRLSAGYSNPAGLAPIRLDYWSRRSDVQFQAVRLTPNHSRASLSSGFDFVNSRWRTALGRFELMTSGSSKLGFDTGFDIEASRWRPLNARWQFAHPRKLHLTLGGQYDLEDTQLRQLSLDLDWAVHPKWRVEYLTRYSGYTHRLDQMDIRVTRDLHCWMGAVSYSKLTGEFQINLGLKAFPSVQTNFGMAHGARFQSGAGTYY